MAIQRNPLILVAILLTIFIFFSFGNKSMVQKQLNNLQRTDNGEVKSNGINDIKSNINNNVNSNIVNDVKSNIVDDVKSKGQSSLDNIDLSKIFTELFDSSESQKYIDKRILFKTMKYMIEERDQEDPELIAFVRDLIVFPPKGEERNLIKKDQKDFSQIGQSLFIDDLLKKQKDGFFIEAGGYDGESHSNSLFFELERNWKGLLIEPIPDNFKILKSKKRQINIINACIANKKPTIAKFLFSQHTSLSGRFKSMDQKHVDRIKEAELKEKREKQSFLYIPCFSLVTMLKALEISKVDYFSLDVEGGELDVLNSIPFDKIKINAMTIEHNGFQKEIDGIQAKMVQKEKFKEIKKDGQDIYLQNENF